MKKQLKEIDKFANMYTKDALDYLGIEGINKILNLYKDETSNNWLLARVKGDYFISLANVDGCKSTVFGSVSHTLSIFKLPTNII